MSSITNPTVTYLLRRTHGGGDAAVVPGQGGVGDLAEAAPPAGVQEVLDHFQGVLESPFPQGRPTWVFLVGGPGNGKSYQLVKLLRRLGADQPAGEPTALAPRGFEVKVPAGTLRVINDASIPEDGIDPVTGPGSLARDLRGAVMETTTTPHLLVNINRGILVEEASRLDRSPGWSTELDLVQWVASESSRAPVAGDAAIKTRVDSDYLRVGQLQAGTGMVDVFALFLDRLSLLERLPGAGREAISGLGDDEPQAQPYKVMKLDSNDRLETPAACLLTRIVAAENFEGGACGHCPAARLCPFLANAKQLRATTGKAGFLRLLRGAEIAGGRLFTYRDLWSICCTSIAGTDEVGWSLDTEDEHAKGVHPCAWVQSHAQEATAGTAGRAARARALVALAAHRIHSALFPDRAPRGLTADQPAGMPEVPTSRSLRVVDPVSDVRPGWAEDVSIALEGTAFQALPGAALRRRSPEFDQAWAALDQEVDELELPWRDCQGVEWKDSDRREVIAWLARRLYRHYAIATGHFGHEDAVQAWIELRRVAGQPSMVVDQTQLGPALKDLLLPRSQVPRAEHQALLPLFSVRTEPLRGPRDDHTWCVAVDTNYVSTSIHAVGDSLWLVLAQVTDHGKANIARLHVDHALCREALASADGAGFTDRGGDAAPKLERARASFIADGRPPGLTVLVQADSRRALFDF